MPLWGWLLAVFYLVGAVLSYGLLKGSAYKADFSISAVGIELWAWTAFIFSWIGIIATYFTFFGRLYFYLRPPRD